VARRRRLARRGSDAPGDQPDTPTPRVLGGSERWAQRAVETGRVIPYLAGATVAVSLLAGFIVTLIDREDFPTFGTGVWWSIVTLATVGYGDVVPHTAWGRVVGSVVIVFGVTFLSFLTAVVTSYFVTALQERATLEERRLRRVEEEETRALLRRLDERLAALEGKLDRKADG
jgi:voltage-gated potassium channel